MNRPRGFLSLASVLVVSVAISIITIGASNPPTTEGSVQAVVRSAIVDMYDAGTFADTSWAGGSLPASSVSQMQSSLRTRLASHMAGAALSQWSETLGAAIDRESDGEHVVVTGGGVDTITYDSLTFESGDALITGRAYVWTTWIVPKSDVVGPRSGHPAGWERYTADVADTPDGWRVVTIDMAPITVLPDGSYIDSGG